MDPLGMNKWMAAILASVLLILLVNTYTDSVFGTGHGEGDHEMAYAIDVPEGATAEAVAEVAAPTIAELMVTADAGKGARQFAKCKACHTVDAGGKNGTGPNLYNLLGSAVGGVDGFRYSAALTGTGATWDYETLNAWLNSPKGTFPGTTMSFAGLKKDDQRADLIAFLRAASDAPMALPEVAAVVEEVIEEVAEETAS